MLLQKTTDSVAGFHLKTAVKLRLSFQRSRPPVKFAILEENGSLPREFWETYIQLTVVERAFRVLKSELLLRPIWHHYSLTQVPWPGAINGGICRITPGSPSQSTKTKTAPVEPLARTDTNGGASPRLFWDPDDFFSPHPAGIHFLMGDGSVLFIKSSINPSVYGSLCSRNLEEIVSAEAF